MWRLVATSLTQIVKGDVADATKNTHLFKDFQDQHYNSKQFTEELNIIFRTIFSLYKHSQKILTQRKQL